MIQIVEGKPFIRPCRSIPSDANEFSDAVTSISALYDQLTKMLPLAGAAALRPGKAGGEPRITVTLRAEAPWMATAIDRLSEQAAMSQWAGKPWLSFRPMLLVGPPGSGKTHFARRIGALSGCGDAILSFAGVNSSNELAGNPRGFRHQQPCFPACVLQRLQVANPVIIIDEVDKVPANTMGDPADTLLGMLERSTASRFFDGCLAAEIDLSHINWVLTANSLTKLSAPLLSRVDVVEVKGPGPEHAEVVLASLWRDVARDAGLPPSDLPRLEAAAETLLLRLFRNTRSVRRLRRAIETVVAVSARHAHRAVN
nr:AAA family ATPase [uncultured Sphingomonas sp.]